MLMLVFKSVEIINLYACNKGGKIVQFLKLVEFSNLKTNNCHFISHKKGKSSLK